MKLIPLKPTLKCTIQRGVRDSELPKAAVVHVWVKKAFAVGWRALPRKTTSANNEELLKLMTVRWVSEEEARILNRDYRGKDYATNVLSFAYDEGADGSLLGDLAITPSVVRRECVQYQKKFEHRLAHMVVHGVLHLLGYEHNSAMQQKEMEQLEVNILAELGFSHPYE